MAEERQIKRLRKILLIMTLGGAIVTAWIYINAPRLRTLITYALWVILFFILYDKRLWNNKLLKEEETKEEERNGKEKSNLWSIH